MRNQRLFVLSLLLSVLVLSVSPWAHAKTKKKTSAPQVPPEYLQRLEDLEQKQKTLERNLELKVEALVEKEKEKPKIKASADGVSISSADGNNEIRFRGLVQADARFYINRNGQGAPDTFILRRVRPYIEGKFAKRFEFKIMPDFGQGKIVLFDAYIDSVIYPEFKIEVGKYKPPVGLERLESAAALHFVERALPTNLVPNRDLGIMAHGDIEDGLVSYQLGVFNGVPDGGNADFDFNDSKDFEGRVFFQPFKKTSVEAGKGLGFGIAGTVGHSSGNASNSQLPAYVTDGQQTFFSYLNDGTPAGTTVAKGDRFRVSPQLYYFYKGFGLLGEYVYSAQGVSLGANSATLKNQAWQVATSYVIGADNSYGIIKPRNPLGWKKGGTGAFEFAARFNELTVDKKAFPLFADPAKSANKAVAWGVGFNWIINQNVKLMLDFEQTHFNGGAKNGGDRQTENTLLNRYQINF